MNTLENRILKSLISLRIHIAFIISVCTVLEVSAGIVCPPNITISCYDDIHHLNNVGVPTLFGYPPELLEYYDQSSNNNCVSGDVTRIWYIDLNQNQQHDTGEHSCVQHIFVQHIDGEVSVTFPADKIYGCKEDIVFEAPDWTSGPCDMMAYSYTDQVYNGQVDACYKILRHFTVINWCTYENSPTDDGIWTHTQVIKVIETTPPAIANCSDVILSVYGPSCTADFVLTNTAADVGDCASDLLEWVVEVDIWGDGIVEHRFSKSEPYPYTISPTKNGQALTIKLQEKAPIGLHKVTWSVRDKCNNYKTCVQKVYVKDTKPPTPYLHQVISSAFTKDMAPLRFPARMFNIDSYDNCTQKSMLRYSFSPNVNDTLKLINCTNSGFQFWTIFVTDMFGNQTSTSVFALVFDNGSCNMRPTINGALTYSSGATDKVIDIIAERQSEAMAISTTSSSTGNILFDQFPLYSDFRFRVTSNHKVSKTAINVLDMILLQDYIFGKYSLTNFQISSADINGDKKINIHDVVALRALILDESTASHYQYYFDQDSVQSVGDLFKLKSELPFENFDGFMDIKGVPIGDISDANGGQVTPRSAILLDISEGVKGVAISPLLDDHWSGLQWTIQVPQDIIDDVLISSDLLNLTQNNISKNRETGTITLLYPGEISAFSTQPVLTLHHPNITKESVRISASSVVVKDEYTAFRVASVAKDVSIFPNPNKGTFEIPGLESIIQITNANGQKCSFESHDQTINITQPTGVYFVTYTAHGSTRTAKVVIYNK